MARDHNLGTLNIEQDDQIFIRGMRVSESVSQQLNCRYQVVCFEDQRDISAKLRFVQSYLSKKISKSIIFFPSRGSVVVQLIMIKSNILYPSVKNELRISLFTWCLSYVRSGEPPSIPVGSAQQCPTGNFHQQYERHIIDWQANSQYYFIACRSLLHFCLLPMRAKRPRDDGFSGFPSQKWGSNDANRDVERYVVGT